MQNIPGVCRPKIKMVRYWYVLGWCLCQDKPYGTIILITISFLIYKGNNKLWSFYHFIFGHQQSFCISTEARFEFSVVLYCYNDLFHEFCMLYYVWLCSWHPCDLTLFLFLFVTNYPIRSDKKFKWSIITWLRLSKVKQHLTSHQFAINQVYQKRRKIWQDINSNLT